MVLNTKNSTALPLGTVLVFFVKSKDRIELLQYLSYDIFWLQKFLTYKQIASWVCRK